MKIISVFIAIFSLQVTIAQYVNLPQIITPSTRIYMSPVGSDSNIGDSLSPVATFSKALDLLNAATSNQSGEVYTEVVLFEGLYLQALIQPLNKFQFANRNLIVSNHLSSNILMTPPLPSVMIVLVLGEVDNFMKA